MPHQADRVHLAEDDLVLYLQPLARLGEGFPGAIIEPLDQQRLNAHAVIVANAGAEQTRRNDLGIIEDEEIAGVQ